MVVLEGGAVSYEQGTPILWSGKEPGLTVGKWWELEEPKGPKIACCRREVGNLLPNSQRHRRTCYALCHILYPVSAAHVNIFRMDSNSTSYPAAEAGVLASRSDAPAETWA